MFFLACSIALRIAMGTSRALPMPKPAWPPWSPTTTSAENVRFFPPFTTFVTRLIETTWSFRYAELVLISRRTESVSLSSCFDIGFRTSGPPPGPLRQAPARGRDTGSRRGQNPLYRRPFLGVFGDYFSDNFRCRDVAAAFDLFAHFFIERTGRANRLRRLIFHYLRADVLRRTGDAQARAFGRSGQRAARADVNSPAMRFAR